MNLNVKKNKKGRVIEFDVIRSKWARGGRGGLPRLLNTSNKMCCLGFYTRACGYQPKEIRGLGLPTEAADYLERGMQWCAEWPDDVANNAENVIAEWNDDEYTTDAEREKQLKSLFRKYGKIKVNFV